MARCFAYFSAWCSRAFGTWQAFLIALLLVLIWGAVTWITHAADAVVNGGNALLSVASFLILFVILAAQNRDGRALHLKLDELLHASKDARNEMIAAEDRTDAEVAALKQGLLGD